MAILTSRLVSEMGTDALTAVGSLFKRSYEQLKDINPAVAQRAFTNLGEVEAEMANASQVTGLISNTWRKLDVDNRKTLASALSTNDWDIEGSNSNKVLQNFSNMFKPESFKKYGYNNFIDAYTDYVHTKPRQFMDPNNILETEWGVKSTNKGFLPQFRQLVDKETPSIDKFDELVNYDTITSKVKKESKKAYDFENVDPKKFEEYDLGDAILYNLNKVGMKHHVGGLEPVAMGPKGGIEYQASDNGLLSQLTKAYNKASTEIERKNIKQIANIALTGRAQRDLAGQALGKFHGAILTNNISTMLKTFPDIFRVNASLPVLLKNTAKAMTTPTGSNNAIDYLNNYLKHKSSKAFYGENKIPDIVQSVETRMRSANILSVMEEDITKIAQNNPDLITQIQAKGGIDPFLDEFLNNTQYQKTISDMLPKGSKFNDLLLKGIQSVRETQGAITPFDYRPVAHSGVGQMLFTFRDAEMQTAGRITHLLKKAIGSPDHESIGELTRFLRPYMLTAITTGGSLASVLGQQTFDSLVNTLNNTGNPELAQGLLTFQDNVQSPLGSFANNIDANKFLPNISSPINAFIPATSQPIIDFFKATGAVMQGEMTDNDLKDITTGLVAGVNAAIPATSGLNALKPLLAPLPLSRVASEGSKALGINPQSIGKGVYKDKLGIQEQQLDANLVSKVLINADPARRQQADVDLRLETAKRSIEKLYDSGIKAEDILEADPDLADVLQELMIAKGVTDPEQNENEIAKLIRNSTVDQDLRKVGELVSSVFEDGEVTKNEEKTFAVLQKLAYAIDWENTKYGSFEQFIQDRMPQQ